MNEHPYPILEFDPNPRALINPGDMLRGTLGMAIDRAVLCFFHEVVTSTCGAGQAEVASTLNSEIGPNPLYALDIEGERVAVVQPGVGAPLSAAILDELIGLGMTKFIACGGAGVLLPEVAVGHLVVPTSAVRDEGTSYHYLPPSREVAPSAPAVTAIKSVLEADNVDYILGKTWTTDAPYRETPDRIARRRDEGCVTVEMEASAFFAVAQFRGVDFGQILYCGDDVSGETWDSRHWDRHTSIREKVFWLAVEAALKL